MNSSKIPRKITGITFKNGETTITFGQQFTPVDQKEVVTENLPFQTDMLRHADFNKAMGMLGPHMLLRTFGFMKFEDSDGKELTKKWFDDKQFEKDFRFEDVEVTALIFTSKKGLDRIQIVGTTATVDEEVVKLKSAPIALTKNDGGYNYPLIDILTAQVQTIMTEAEEFLNYKSGNGQLRIAV